MTSTIEQVANSSEVSKIVFKALSDKQRARRATDLTNLYRTIQTQDETIQEKEVLAVFKKLQDAKVGSLIIGRRNKHNRFVWNYNLKDVAQVANGKMDASEVTPASGPIKRKVSKTSRKIKDFKIAKPSILKRKAKKLVDTVVDSPKMIESVEEKVVSKGSALHGPRLQFNVELSPETSVKDISALLELIQSLQKK